MLKQPTVFISAPSDMTEEVAAVQEAVRRLARRLPGGRLASWFWRDSDPGVFVSGRPYQTALPRMDDPNLRAVVCLFGERVGTPLPGDFSLPLEVKEDLPPYVRFPHYADDGDAVPLTGTLFEMLWAHALSRRSGGRCLVFTAFRADRAQARDTNLTPAKRRWGLQRLYTRLAVADPFLEDPSGQEYQRQITYLTRFFDRYFASHPSQFFRTPNDLVRLLVPKLEQRLELAATDRLANLWGLLPYEVEDHRYLRGRDEEVNQYIDLLCEQDAPGKAPLLFLSGASGAGKSSVLRAGLVGTLATGALTTLPPFRHAVVTPRELAAGAGPGTDPVLGLARALAAPAALGPELLPDRRDAAAFAEDLAGLPRERQLDSLTNRVNTALRRASGARLVLALDQAEQIFVPDGVAGPNGGAIMVAETGEPWRALVAAVVRLASEAQVWTVLAFATPWQDRIVALFGEEVRHAVQKSLGNPGPAQLERIVEETLELVGLRAEPALLEALVQAAERLKEGGRTAVLPLLAVAMERLHRAWQARRAAGLGTYGLRHSMDLLALPGQRQELCRDLRDLTAGSESAKPLRSLRKWPGPAQVVLGGPDATRLTTAEYGAEADLPQVIEALAEDAWAATMAPHAAAAEEIGQNKANLAGVLRRLVRVDLADPARLVLTPCPRRAEPLLRMESLVKELERRRLLQAAGPESVVPAHEAVLRHWSRARAWLEEERELLPSLPVWARDAEEWKSAPAEEKAGLLLRTRSRVVRAERALNLWRKDLDAYGPNLAQYLREALLAFWAPRDGQQPLKDDQADEAGNTRLGVACDLGDEELALAYLAAGANPELPMGEARQTPLHIAAFHGVLPVIRRLLELGATIARADSAGGVPLYYAAFGGQAEACRLLLDHGADPAAADPEGITALHLAAIRGHAAAC